MKEDVGDYKEQTDPCPCSKPCKDCPRGFQKLAVLKKTGLVIYRRLVPPEDVNEAEVKVTDSQEKNNVFILHNIKDEIITATDFMPELEEIVPCPRCQYIMKNVLEVSAEMQVIDKNDIIGVCDHCKLKKKPCAQCEKSIKQFLDSKNKDKELLSTKKGSREWQSKNELNDALMDENENIEDLKITHSDLRVNQLFRQKSTKSERELNLRALYREPTYGPGVSHTRVSEFPHRTDYYRHHILQDGPQRELAKPSMKFVDLSEVKPKLTIRKGQIISADEGYSSKNENQILLKSDVSKLESAEPQMKSMDLSGVKPKVTIQKGLITFSADEDQIHSLKNETQILLKSDDLKLEAAEPQMKFMDLSRVKPRLTIRKGQIILSTDEGQIYSSKNENQILLKSDVSKLESEEPPMKSTDLSRVKPKLTIRKGQIRFSADEDQTYPSKFDDNISQSTFFQREYDEAQRIPKHAHKTEKKHLGISRSEEEISAHKKYDILQHHKSSEKRRFSLPDLQKRELYDDDDVSTRYSKHFMDSSEIDVTNNEKALDEQYTQVKRKKVGKSIGLVEDLLKPTTKPDAKYIHKGGVYLKKPREGLPESQLKKVEADFKFYFPHDNVIKQIEQGHKSSSELIQEVQSMLQLKAEELKRKEEEKERKRLLQKEKVKQAAEKKKLLAEEKNKAEMENKDKLQSKLQEENEKNALKTSADGDPNKTKESKTKTDEKESKSKESKTTSKLPTPTEQKGLKSEQKKPQSQTDDIKPATKDTKDVSKGTKAKSKDTKSESKETKSESKETKAESKEAKDESKDSKSKSKEIKFDLKEAKDESKYSKSKSKDTKSESKEAKDESKDSKSKSKDTKSKLKEAKDESNETKAESKESKQKSKEPSAESKQPISDQKELQTDSKKKPNTEGLTESKEPKGERKESKFDPKNKPKEEQFLTNPKYDLEDFVETYAEKKERERREMEEKRLRNKNIKKKGITTAKKHRTPRKQKKGDLILRDSDVDLDYFEKRKKEIDPYAVHELVKGQRIMKYKLPLFEKVEDRGPSPVLFHSNHIEAIPEIEEVIKPAITEKNKPLSAMQPPTKTELQPSKGVLYALSDRTFIEKGWTMLPTEKVVRKMNVYRMRPAHPEFDWFNHNKNKRLMLYDTGERLAEFDDNGRGRWYYKNERMALEYYDAEELNAQQRFVVYSNGEPDERGRSRPYTVLATFDYLGNGVVFDHSGKIRLKYNQTEGVVLDRSLGPVSHWKWHSLNDPPVLQQVMIDTQMSHKDPQILKMGGPQQDVKPQADKEDMLAIEFDNFIKEKSKKLTQSFKPFQIRMKALKINEHFSLKVLDQASVYLIYRDGTTNLKLNIGMILDHKEIVDTDTAEVGEVSSNMERLPARTDSIAWLQKNVDSARRFERTRTEREHRLCPPLPCLSSDKMTAAVSRPLRVPLLTVHPHSATAIAPNCYCNSRKLPTANVYYDNRLL